jgi:hypothetical protein
MFHLADIENNPNATATDIEHARLGGYRTRLMVPMVRGDRTLGLIAVTREDPTPFSDQLVELLRPQQHPPQKMPWCMPSRKASRGADLGRR